MPRCAVCHEERWLLNPAGVCSECADNLKAQEADRKLKAIVLTTALDVPHRSTDQVLGIVASEAALGMSVFKDIANNWRDFVGGRSSTAQNTLREARTACMAELRREAAALDADAVIAVSLDYNEISTGSGGIVFVAASGTAVKLATVSDRKDGIEEAG